MAIPVGTLWTVKSYSLYSVDSYHFKGDTFLVSELLPKLWAVNSDRDLCCGYLKLVERNCIYVVYFCTGSVRV